MKKRFESKGTRRILSLVVCAAMVLTLLPGPVLAAEDCTHHPAHTPECGYVEAVAGQPCTHVCGDGCVTLTTACTHDHGAECYGDGVLPAEGEEKTADACTHACSEESGCVTKTPACVHTAHDGTCGYAAAVAGQPCGFVCTECAEVESEPDQPEEKVITGWEWVDEWEIIDPDSGEAALPFASAENVARFDDIVALLPVSILADGEELTLGDWVCPDFPVETGAYEGTYVFETTLPEGFVLSGGGNVLNLTVVLGDPEGAPGAALAITPAEPPTGTHTLNGTSYTGVYELSTPAHLYWFANEVTVNRNPSINAIVMNDITVNSGVLNGDGSLNTGGSFERWTPIGDAYSMYSGTFDGNGKTISGLYMNDESISTIGLFGVIRSGGTVVNVKIADSYFAGKNNVGGVCGSNFGTVHGCANSGSVTGSGNFIGGVCGYNSVTVSGCYSSGSVTGSRCVGGVCGSNFGTVLGCANSGTVTGSNKYVGGVCGDNNQGSVSRCYSSGSVTGSSYVGGVCGRDYLGSVSRCYFDNTAYTGIAIGGSGPDTQDVCGKSPAEFASGEVAYLLNGSTSEGTLVWYQNIDKTGVTRDRYPQFTGATVYKTSDASPCQGYSNTPNLIRAHNLQNHACTYCGYWEPVSVTVSGITAKDKVYDGGVTAQLDFTNVRLNGVLSAYPNVTVTATGTFANADVGQNKPVTIRNLTLTGADASRYRLADSGQQTSATASITPRPVTIHGVAVEATKVYDGTRTARITSSGFVFVSDLTLVPGIATYDTKDVGEGKTVTFSGYALHGPASRNYTLVQPDPVKADITPRPVTIQGAAVEATKVYDGSTTARITSDGTLSANFDGSNLTIVPGSAAYDTKNVGVNKPVTFSGFSLGGSAAGNYTLTAQPADAAASITAKPVTLTVTVEDKAFDGTPAAQIDSVTPDGFVTGDVVSVKNGNAAFAYANVGSDIPVSFTDFTLTGADAGNYSLTNPQPTGVTGNITPTRNYLSLVGNSDFAGHTEIWVDGVKYPIQADDGCYVNLPNTGDLLTIFNYEMGSSSGTHENYPTEMAVYRINRTDSGANLERITEFDDLLQYSGCSIRVTGKRGIRMITSLTKQTKTALIRENLAGYKLVEYGTVVQWADDLRGDSLTLANGKHNHAYKKGVSDPVFATVGDLTQYTNVLVWDSLTDAQLGQDIVMRPYIILKDGSGNPVTLYGGTVSRSIGYIAYQNRAAFTPGTAAYEYVWGIIHAVYGNVYDSEYQG